MRSIHRVLSAAIMSLILTSPPAVSANPKAKAKTQSSTPARDISKISFEEYTKSLLDEAPYKEMSSARLPTAEETKRALGQVDGKGRSRPARELASLNPPQALTEFVASLNSIRTPEALDEKLALWSKDEEFAKLSPDEKFVAAMLVPLRVLRGVTWKMMPFFQSGRVMQSFVVSTMQRLAGSLKVYFPSTQWNALGVYLIQPYIVPETGQPARQFRSEADLQTLAVAFHDALDIAYSRIGSLPLSSQTILFDKRVLYGPDGYVSGTDRYRVVGFAEQQAMMSALKLSMARLATFRAYSIHRIMALNTALGERYALDGLRSRDETLGVMGVSAMERTAVVRLFPTYDVRLPDGRTWMRASLRHLNHFAAHAERVLEVARTARNTDDFLIDLDFFKSDEREFGFALENLKAALAGPHAFRSNVTGESIRIDLKSYYEEPPADMKALLPIGFDDKDGAIVNFTKELGNSGAVFRTKFRNYYHGRPTHWSKTAYAPYVLGLENEPEKTDAIARVARVVSQSWGGILVGAPLFDVVQ